MKLVCQLNSRIVLLKTRKTGVRRCAWATRTCGRWTDECTSHWCLVVRCRRTRRTLRRTRVPSQCTRTVCSAVARGSTTNASASTRSRSPPSTATPPPRLSRAPSRSVHSIATAAVYPDVIDAYNPIVSYSFLILFRLSHPFLSLLMSYVDLDSQNF